MPSGGSQVPCTSGIHLVLTAYRTVFGTCAEPFELWSQSFDWRVLNPAMNSSHLTSNVYCHGRGRTIHGILRRSYVKPRWSRPRAGEAPPPQHDDAASRFNNIFESSNEVAKQKKSSVMDR
ncbi:uncharacterized protein N7458_010788 [Penicillium daleae]|uniref:Uncharacterized protein n=1 Tax=Penicillium daleae TaxID=63821 RepID=A0AAD6C022_9EURO|nr:uncharacterized protein N7458_010788 [Penicillium daleae]KAJ5439790.1 hypothetical protein N7458_010788 [Penicillium daleae]